MQWLNTFWVRLRAVWRSGEVHEEIDEELRFHLEMRTEENIRQGMTSEDARRAAERQFGPVRRIKDLSYDVRGGGWIETLLQDVRYGARMLIKSPGFTAVAVLSLALGIGACATIFSAVNSVLLRPLPFTRQDQLVVAWKQDAVANNPLVELSIPEFVDWQKQNQSFENLAAMPTTLYGYGYTVTGQGEPYQIESARVSASFFPVLGVKASLGRVFVADEDHPGAEHVVVLNYRLWHDRFNGDPELPGRQITLSGVNYTVVGVMPPEFDFPKGADVWTPLMTNQRQTENRGAVFLQAIGRLKADVTWAQANAELNTIVKRLAAQYPEADETGHSVVITPLSHYIFGDARPALYLLLAASGLLLMIACVNVANLLLARATVRRREIAVRAALGGSRRRLFKQFLTESMILALLGGTLGIVLAYGLITLLRLVTPTDVPRADAIHLDATVFAFTAIIACLTALLFGLAPALSASKTDLSEALKEGSTKISGARRGGRLRRVLVVAEVALTLAVLAGAGLILRSFVNLRQVRLGFDPRNALTAQLALQGPKYATAAQRRDFYRQLLERIEARPGVMAAGGVLIRPLEGTIGWDVPYAAEGQSLDEAKTNPVPNYEAITPHYFRALGIPIVKGRDFTEDDRADAPPVVIISETMARRIFPPGVEPLGRRIKLGPSESDAPWQTIVGLVGDARYRALSDMRMDVYVPYLQTGAPVRYLIIRTTAEPTIFIPTLRREIAELDPNQALTSVLTMDQLVSRSLARPRFNTMLLGFFAALATLLAGVGIYGVISFTVTERTHEVGIRIALGAGHRDVLRLVIGQVMKLVIAGFVAGLALSLLLSRMVSGLIFGVTATDPITFIAVLLLLSGVALLASFIPALRATRVDPLIVLRYE